MKLAGPAVLAGLIAAAAGYLLNDAVGWRQDGGIVGRWTCKMRNDKADLQLELMFNNEGMLSTTVWVRAFADGHSVAAKLLSEDEWAVRGTSLRIRHGDMRTISASGDGLRIAPSVIDSVFSSIGGTSVHTIATLTDNELTYGTGAGPLKCER
jgi:hypothetical protein